MKLIRPTSELVLAHVGIPINANNIIPPDDSKAEWRKCHREFVLHVLLPQVRPPERVWRICAEAYLTDVVLEQKHSELQNEINDVLSFEQAVCDGSSIVPDIAYRWGNIKDPWSMGHDLLYTLRRHRMRDVFGTKWEIEDAHRMYRDGWFAQNEKLIGNIWYFGLLVGGWIPWNRSNKYKPEPVTDTIVKLVQCDQDAVFNRHCCVSNKYS